MCNINKLNIGREFIGCERIGSLQLKYQNLQTEQVVCCNVFVRNGDGGKTSDSVYVEVKE